MWRPVHLGAGPPKFLLFIFPPQMIGSIEKKRRMAGCPPLEKTLEAKNGTTLVTGHWSLATGHWSLVTGHWSRVTAESQIRVCDFAP